MVVYVYICTHTYIYIYMYTYTFTYLHPSVHVMATFSSYPRSSDASDQRVSSEHLFFLLSFLSQHKHVKGAFRHAVLAATSLLLTQ